MADKLYEFNSTGKNIPILERRGFAQMQSSVSEMESTPRAGELGCMAVQVLRVGKQPIQKLKTSERARHVQSQGTVLLMRLERQG